MARAGFVLLVVAIAGAAGAAGFLAGARKGFDEGYVLGALHREILAGSQAMTSLRLVNEQADELPGWLEYKLDTVLVTVLEHDAALAAPPLYASPAVRDGEHLALMQKSVRGFAAYRKTHPRTSEFPDYPDLDARVREAVERYASAP
jgi:hypothetical protein